MLLKSTIWQVTHAALVTLQGAGGECAWGSHLLWGSTTCSCQTRQKAKDRKEPTLVSSFIGYWRTCNHGEAWWRSTTPGDHTGAPMPGSTVLLVQPGRGPCRMPNNTGKEKEGILDLEPELGSRPLNPGCLNKFQKKNLGSWQGSKWKQKILSGRK